MVINENVDFFPHSILVGQLLECVLTHNTPAKRLHTLNRERTLAG